MIGIPLLTRTIQPGTKDQRRASNEIFLNKVSSVAQPLASDCLIDIRVRRLLRRHTVDGGFQNLLLPLWGFIGLSSSADHTALLFPQSDEPSFPIARPALPRCPKAALRLAVKETPYEQWGP
jgi:hypothetical protein